MGERTRSARMGAQVMRLIDADAIPYVKTMYSVGLLDMVTRFTIDTMPTIDAVPVVRCKDCKHLYESWGEKYCHSGLTLTYTSDEWFCPLGEREDDGMDS